jgi:hypothetical protein
MQNSGLVQLAVDLEFARDDFVAVDIRFSE